jgi:hypothetical protein
MIQGFARVRAADGQDEALVKRLFLVRHQVCAKLVSIEDTGLNHDQPAM